MNGEMQWNRFQKKLQETNMGQKWLGNLFGQVSPDGPINGRQRIAKMSSIFSFSYWPDELMKKGTRRTCWSGKLLTTWVNKDFPWVHLLMTPWNLFVVFLEAVLKWFASLWEVCPTSHLLYNSWDPWSSSGSHFGKWHCNWFCSTNWFFHYSFSFFSAK